MNYLRPAATVKATFSLALSALQASLDLTAFKCAFIQQLNMAGHWNPSQPAKNMIVQLDDSKNQICQVILVQACLGSHDRWTAGPPNSQTFLNISPFHTKTILRQL